MRQRKRREAEMERTRERKRQDKEINGDKRKKIEEKMIKRRGGSQTGRTRG